MDIKLNQGTSSGLVGLLGLLGATAISLGVAAPAQAAGTAAPSAAAAPSATAGVAKTHFLGAHPLAGRPGTGYCYIDVPHVHDYVPDQPAVYQQVGDDYVFTGDPVPFGYEGEKTVFYGHHPVPVTVDVAPAARPPMTFCFIKGPHYHDYPQPEAPGFKQKDQAVFYIGPVPPEIARERLQRERAVELEYQPYVAQRPQVVVSPPPEWQGVVWTPPPPRVVVASSAPGVVVAAPAVPVVVAVPNPQVIVTPPIMPTLVVNPPPPGVVVMAPPPPGVVIMAPPPGGLFIAPPPPHTVVVGAHGPGVVFVGHGNGGGKGWKGNRGWHGGGKGGHGWKGGRRR